jgi:sulfide dehydrogenase [flavocytochrome c] flavoprotein subunit
MMTDIGRRGFLKITGASMLAAKWPSMAYGAAPHVVVVGGGAAGTIVARRISASGSGIRVTLIERNERYYSRLISNQMFSGLETAGSTDFGYESLGKHDINVVHDVVSTIDSQKRLVSLASGNSLTYDRLVLAPGIRVNTQSIVGYDSSAVQRMPHAWTDQEQALLLRRQIESMRPGGIMMMAVPPDPISSPCAPYERASLIAHFLQQQNPSAKLLICDAKTDFPLSGLFRAAWDELYPGMIEWVGVRDTGGAVSEVDSGTMKVLFPKQSFTADVVNIIPPQSAGNLATRTGVIDASGWCPVDIKTFESVEQPGVYVVGDATQAHALPKTTQMANSQAKVCASAVVESLTGVAMEPARFIDVEYNIVAPNYAIYSITTYRLDDTGNGVVAVSNRQSSPDDERGRDFSFALSWYNNISREMFG